MNWTAVSGADGYKVHYGTAIGGYDITLDAGNVTDYIVTGLADGTTYYFVVTAYDLTQESADSNEVNAVPVASPPLLITLEAETMPVKTKGGLTSNGWNIWSNGYIEETVAFPSTAMYEFEIIAKGSYADGAWPNMQLRIDQETISNTTVNSNSWTSFVIQADVTGGNHAVAVAFTNDYYNPGVEDRNLYVDKIIIREVVEPSGTGAGTITYEIWEGMPGVQVSDLTNNANYPDNPTQSTT